MGFGHGRQRREARTLSQPIVEVALPPFRGHGLCGFLRIRDLE